MSSPNTVAGEGANVALSGVTLFIRETKWQSVLALVLSAAALAFAIAAWARQDQSDARWQDSQRKSDAAWLASQSSTDSKWEAAQRSLETRFVDLQRDADGRWQNSYRELERETRLVQLKHDDLRVALLAQGIKTNKHAANDSP